MRHFKNNGQVYGYDETDITQQSLIAAAIAANWAEITGSWPPAPTAAQQWVTYKTSVQAALDATDTTVHRVIESVALGNTTLATADVVAFMQYRVALRAILSEPQPATIPTALPTKPAYPANT